MRHFRPGAMGLYASITRLLTGGRRAARRGADGLREQGVPEDATRVAALPIMFAALDIVVGGDERARRRPGTRRTSA